MADLKTDLAECVRLRDSLPEGATESECEDYNTTCANLIVTHGDELMEAVEGWRPIETCEEGQRVVLYCDARGNRWTQTADCRIPMCGHPPTHWRPLPAPPDAAIAGSSE